jgi:hypothetical protein
MTEIVLAHGGQIGADEILLLLPVPVLVLTLLLLNARRRSGEDPTGDSNR